MDSAAYTAFDANDTLYPSDMWIEILGETLGTDPNSVHLFAQMMLGVKDEVISGTKGATRGANTVMDLIHELFVYSKTFELARRLWIISLDGQLTPDNDPEVVLEAAIEQGLKETLAARPQVARSSARTPGRRRRAKAANKKPLPRK